MDNYGTLVMHIEDLLKARNISKNRLCKDLDIARHNLNRYCRNDFQRLDSNLICKLCHYLKCDINDLIEYIQPDE